MATSIPSRSRNVSLVIIVLLLFLTETNPAQAGQNFFELRVDGEHSRNKPEGMKSDTNSAIDYNIFYQHQFFSQPLTFLFPTLDYSNADRSILDREDEVRISGGVYYRPDGKVYYPTAPQQGVSFGAELWIADREANSQDDDQSGLTFLVLDAAQRFRKDQNDKPALYHRTTITAETISSDDPFSEGERISVSWLLSDVPQDDGFSWTAPRVTIRYFDIDARGADEELLYSIQARMRWWRPFEKYQDWAFVGEILAGYDKFNNFRGQNDFSSAYIRPGVYIAYNPERGKLGAGSGGSAGGNWRRP